MAQEQRIVHYWGAVQGVGFRYTACRIAGRYAVAGYVRNLADGRVECLVEGAGDQVEAFLEEVAETMGTFIRRQTQQAAPCSGRYASFGVRA